MKKITLFGALLVAGMATAQVNVMTSEKLETKAFQAKSIETTATISKEKFTAESYANRFAKKASNAASADYTGVDYYAAPGMMHAGVTPEGGMFYPFILLPYQDNVVWTNYAQELARATWLLEEAATTWSEDGEEVAKESVTYETYYGCMGMAPTPATSDHTFTYQETLHNIKGYQYGSNEAKQYVISAVGPDMLTDGNMPMTLCGIYCDPIHGSNGSDFYMVGSSYGPYANGCGLTIEGKRLDTIGSIVRNVSPMKINKIDILVYNSSKQGIEKMMPEGAEVKVEIFAADLTEGVIYTDEPLYTTTITAENYTDVAGYIGTLSAAFYEEDLFGGLQEVPVLVEGDFYVQLTNFNESGCDFGIYSDYYTPGGTTLWTWDGEFTTLWSSGGSNLLISYDAYWPVVVNGASSDALVAPVEGGVAMDGEYGAIALLSNVADVESNWIFDAPEWIEIAYDESTWAEYGYVVAQFAATALPEGETGRQGIVTVEADGYVCEVVINQGEVEGDDTAVDNVVAPVFNGKTFNLLGVEVDENYKGIVIKNGQKYIQ